MKKTQRFGTAAIAAVATLSLAACGFGGSSGDGGDAEGSTTIDLLVPSYSDGTKANWQTVIQGFEKANPDITVKLEVQSWDNLEKVVSTKVQAGEAPDIYNGGPFAGFVGDELLYPVEDVVSEDTFSDFQGSFLENAEVEGTAYALPLIASARALFVNNALLEQAGVEAPTDWDSLLDAATKVSALGGGVAGYGMPLGSEEAQAEAAVWLWGGGGSFGDASEITIDTPENLVGAEQIKKMIDAGATQADPGATQRSPLMDIFIQGKIGMQVGLPPTVGQIEEGNPDLDYSIVPIPTKDGSPFTLGVMDQLMAFQNDGDKAEAITAFFDYYYSADVYVPWVQAEGFLPVTKSGSEQLAGEESLKPFLDVLPDAQFYPSTNTKWSAADGAFKSLFGQLQQKPAQDVLTETQAQVDAG
jgi:multiple sugar transport system substrate-binding protein